MVLHLLIELLCQQEDLYATSGARNTARTSLFRQHSNPQLPGLAQEQKYAIYSNPTMALNPLRVSTVEANQQQQQNLVSSMNLAKPCSPILSKPPRIITTLRKSTSHPSESDVEVVDSCEQKTQQ